MMRSWDLVRVFLAFYRSGSYEAASRTLGMDISTVRRKIQTLESNLGMALFERDARGVVLRPDHDALISAAEEMEASAVRFEQNSQEVRKGGIVRLSMLDIFAALLVDQLGVFRAGHPDIILDFTTETHFVDLDAEGVDVAVRLARPTKGAAGMRKVAEVPFGRFVSPSYLEQRPPHASEPFDIISLSSDFWHRDHEFKFVDERRSDSRNMSGNVVARVDSYPISLKLCQEGLGVALLPCFIARTVPELVPYDEQRVIADLWLVARREHARAWRTRETINFLVESFGRLNRSLFAAD